MVFSLVNLSTRVLIVVDYHSEAKEIKLIFASNLASSKCLFDTYQVFELYSRMTEIENVTYENWSPN